MRRQAGWTLGRARPTIFSATGHRILCYHGVCRKDPFRYNTLFITARKLEDQLRFFKDHFHLLSLQECFSGKIPPENFSLALSFDDGFRNNYRYVWPLLEKYQVPATFFVTAIRETGADILWNDALSIAFRGGLEKITIGKEPFSRTRKGFFSADGRLLNDYLRFTTFGAKEEMLRQCQTFVEQVDPDYWQQLTETELREMAASPLVTIGSHGFFHNDLARIPLQDAILEMQQSRKWLQEITGQPIEGIAFPYGSFHASLIEAAIAVGFTQCYGTELPTANSHPHPALRERLTINPFISTFNQAYAAITGHYH